MKMGDKRNQRSERADKRHDSSDRSDRRHGSSQRSDRKTVKGGRDENINKYTKQERNHGKAPEKSTRKDTKSKPTQSRSKSDSSKSSKSADLKSSPIDSNLKNDSEEQKEKTKQEKTQKQDKSSPKRIWVPKKGIFDNDDEDSDSENESEVSKLERPLGVALIKRDVKKTISINVSKAKLPFIGRMPFMIKGGVSKKTDENVKENDNTNKSDEKNYENEKKDDNNKSNLIWPDIPEVKENILENNTISNKNLTQQICVAKEEEEKDKEIIAKCSLERKPSRWDDKVNLDNTKSSSVQRSTLMLSKTPTLAQRVAQAKQIVAASISKVKTGVEEPVDMEIDDEDKPEESLPQDFQNTLDILFPSQNPGSHIIQESGLPRASVDSVMPPCNVPSVVQTTAISNSSVPLLSGPVVYMQSSTNQTVSNVTGYKEPGTSLQSNVSNPAYAKHLSMTQQQQSAMRENQWIPNRLPPDSSHGLSESVIDPNIVRPDQIEHQPTMRSLDHIHPMGPMRQGNTKHYPIGLMDHGSMGPMRPGHTDNEPRGLVSMGPGSGPLGLGNRGLGPMGPGPIDHGPMDRGPMGPGPIDRGPMGSGPMDCGPMGTGPMDRRPMGPGPMGPGPIDHRPMDHGPMGPGPRDHGPMGPGPMDHGPMGMGQGPISRPHPWDPMIQGPRPLPPPPPCYSMGARPISPDCLMEDGMKKKNAPSQKKRQQMKRRREELEAKDKELKEKIALQLQLLAKKHTDEKEKEAKKKARDELAMLGIDEDDLAAQPL